jgi:hypothetical protein
LDKVAHWLGGKLKDIRRFLDDLYEHDIHAKRVDALAGATLGVMTGASLAVAVIGRALAQARGLVTKHAIKQSLPRRRPGSTVFSATNGLMFGRVSPDGCRIWLARGGRSSLPWIGPISIATDRRRWP